MLRGLRSADVDYHELLHTLNATRWQRLRIIEFPACLPYLFAALKVGASAAFIGAIVGEWIGANEGLGYYIVISSNYFRIPAMWAAIVVAAALTLLLVAAVSITEHFSTPWRQDAVGDLA
jgi:NitT/TauT family transport system permease protein